MRIQYYIKVVSLSAFCLAVVSGCGTMQKSGVSGAEGRVVTMADGRKVVVNGGQKLAPPKDTKSGKNAKQKKSKKGTEPQGADREVVGGTVAVGTDSTVMAAVGDSRLRAVSDSIVSAEDTEFSLNGEWTIYSVRGNVITGEERPYVTFDIPANRFYGNNGCNVINGDLRVGPDRMVKLGNMISTMKMCQDDQYQYLINLALSDVVSYTPRRDRHETFLDLEDSSGRTILVLRRHNMDFLNGAWKVVELNSTPLVQEGDATMTFDTTDLRIHGTTGCNIFNGELFIDPDKTSSLQVMKLATTRMGCPPDSRETEFLLALESVESAKSLSGDEVALYDTDGRLLFKLVRMELRDEVVPIG